MMGAALCAALFLSHTPASAHRAKTVFTIVEYAKDSGNIEVTHSIHMHDAQKALQHITGSLNPSMEQLEFQARMLLHIAKFFTVKTDGEAVKLENIGAEVEGDHIFFYFESAPVNKPKAISIRNDIYMDIFPDQVNQTNMKVDALIRTIISRKEGEEKESIF